MSDASDLLKGINSIWVRLFNHRGFLNGEIQLILRELEQARREQEVEELFRCLEITTNIKDTQIERVKQLIDILIPQANIDLRHSLQVCKDIEGIEERHRNSEAVNVNRKKVDEDWGNFIEDVSTRCTAIDQDYEQKESELRQFYKELERKLARVN